MFSENKRVAYCDPQCIYVHVTKRNFFDIDTHSEILLAISGLSTDG